MEVINKIIFKASSWLRMMWLGHPHIRMLFSRSVVSYAVKSLAFWCDWSFPQGEIFNSTPPAPTGFYTSAISSVTFQLAKKYLVSWRDWTDSDFYSQSFSPSTSHPGVAPWAWCVPEDSWPLWLPGHTAGSDAASHQPEPPDSFPEG